MVVYGGVSAGGDIRYLRQVYALGCPYQCTFCIIQTIGKRPDYFPVDRVLEEIRAYRAHHGSHHHIYWGDETFTLHPQCTLELLEALGREGDIRYDCQTRLNCLTNNKIVRKLKSSGCQWVGIGLETGFQESHETHKNHMKLSAAYRIPESAMFEHPEHFGMKLLHRDFRLYHEGLPPVFATDKATSDQAYEVFLEGLEMFTKAMDKLPGAVPAPTPPISTAPSGPVPTYSDPQTRK